MNVGIRYTIARYCGLKVEVVSLMEHCSMICFGGRTFIVDTADLAPGR